VAFLFKTRILSCIRLGESKSDKRKVIQSIDLD
jgi:hypothetical protein